MPDRHPHDDTSGNSCRANCRQNFCLGQEDYGNGIGNRFRQRTSRRLRNTMCANLQLLVAVCFLSATTGGLGMSDISIPHARQDPEYACVYDHNSRSPGLLDQISAAHRYKQYLTAQNRILRRKIAHVCAAGSDGEAASLASISQSREQEEDEESGGLSSVHAADSPWNVPAMDGLSDDEGVWRSDVSERYKELVPPKKRKPSVAAALSDVCLRKAAEAAMSLSPSASFSPQTLELANSAPRSTGGKVEEAILMLDLDKCSFYGNDANDLGIALQWMEKGYEDVQALYRILFNPCVKRTHLGLQQHAESVRVVIYTMRATFLVYRSCFRDAVIPLRWNPAWHRGAQVYFPSSVRSADEIIASYSGDVRLLDEERVDLRKSLERLLATRDVIAEELGLPALPDLVVTATPKTVEGTAEALGYPLENAYLWDDNRRLSDNPRVVSVPPFEALPPPAAAALERFLDHRLPARTLEADLVEFMLGADPRDRVLDADPVTGQLHYRIPQCRALPEWPLPDLVPAGATSMPAAALLSRDMSRGSLKAGSGYLSPVTPESDLQVGAGGGSLGHAGASHEKLREQAQLVGAP